MICISRIFCLMFIRQFAISRTFWQAPKKCRKFKYPKFWKFVNTISYIFCALKSKFLRQWGSQKFNINCFCYLEFKSTFSYFKRAHLPLTQKMAAKRRVEIEKCFLWLQPSHLWLFGVGKGCWVVLSADKLSAAAAHMWKKCARGSPPQNLCWERIHKELS